MDNYQRVEVTSREQWRNWLVDNHQQLESIWLVTYKKHTRDRYLAYDEIVEEALCFGWIDSLPRKLDSERTMLLLSPRRKGSYWSRLNKERVQRLVDLELMTLAGMAKVEQAQADGTWSFLDDVEALVIPDDLAKALAENPTASKYFENFSPSSKKGILQWIKQSKRETTRTKRISETLAKAEKNIRAQG